MMKAVIELLKEFSPKLIGFVFICVLLFVGSVVLVALVKKADVDLAGIKVSWRSENQSLGRQLDQAKVAIDHERSKEKETAAKFDDLSQAYGNARQELESCRKDLSGLQVAVTRRDSLIEEKSDQIRQYKSDKSALSQLEATRSVKAAKEGRLKFMFEELRGAAATYEGLKSVCERTGDSFYKQDCSKAGEQKGIVDSLKLEIEFIKKDLSEESKLLQALEAKLGRHN